jgi:hypothetical protein
MPLGMIRDDESHDLSSHLEDGNGGGVQLPVEHIESETGRPASALQESWEMPKLH